MVRVVKIKPPKKEKPKRVDCDKCGAVLEYTSEDIKEYHGTDISGGPDGESWISCPRCASIGRGHRVILKSW